MNSLFEFGTRRRAEGHSFGVVLCFAELHLEPESQKVASVSDEQSLTPKQLIVTGFHSMLSVGANQTFSAVWNFRLGVLKFLSVRLLCALEL
jgi:hypothetical protein